MKLLNLNAHSVCVETTKGTTLSLPPRKKITVQTSLFDEDALDMLAAKNVRVFRLPRQERAKKKESEKTVHDVITEANEAIAKRSPKHEIAPPVEAVKDVSEEKTEIKQDIPSESLKKSNSNRENDNVPKGLPPRKRVTDTKRGGE